MKKEKTCVDPKNLEAFYDGELEGEEKALLREHTFQCPACMKTLQENEILASSFAEMMKQESFLVDLNSVDRGVWKRIERSGTTWSLVLSRKSWVPAIAVVATLVFFLAVFRSAPSHSEPSAYVQSLKGDVASVMILETPQSRQTVLWFQEAPSRHPDMGEGQGYDGWLFLLKQQHIV